MKVACTVWVGAKGVKAPDISTLFICETVSKQVNYGYRKKVMYLILIIYINERKCRQ